MSRNLLIRIQILGKFLSKFYRLTVDIIDFFRLRVRSQSLDVVYNPNASQWLSSFLAGPHQQRLNLPTRSRIGADLMKNWENILESDIVSI